MWLRRTQRRPGIHALIAAGRRHACSGVPSGGSVLPVRRRLAIPGARRPGLAARLRVLTAAPACTQAGQDLAAGAAMHHGEEIVRPDREVPRALVAMRHEVERTDPRARLLDQIVGDVPHRHAVRRHAERVVVGNDADAADRAAAQQAAEARDHLVFGGTDGLGERQAALLRLSVAAAVQQAAGREPGTVPAGWLRWAGSVLPSRVVWRRLLAAEVRREVAAVAGAVDYSYRRPSRRADAVRPVLLPALERPVPSVAIVCDTSGSMHDHLLERALAEVETILARAGVRQGGARVLAVDTTVHAVRRVTAARQVVLAGGGGTDMGAGIAAAAALRPPPSVAIVLTDGYTPWPADGPKGMRVVVGLLTQSGTPPPARPPAWARVVVIEEGFDR